MGTLPTGTVTFLFTDIEGSTKLAQEHPGTWEGVRSRHHEILSEAIESNDGYVFHIIGDAFCAAFHRAKEALKAAIRAQQDLQNEQWKVFPIRVRMGVHTGEAEAQESDYHGYLSLSLVQRVMTAGHGGQVLVSGATENLLRGQLPPEYRLIDLGRHNFKSIPQAVRIFQVLAPDLQKDFPPLRTFDILPNNLPAQLTSFVGREKELADVKRLLSDTHMLTLIGPGGTGKTRLSIQATNDLLNQYPDGVWLVDLAPILDPLLVPRTTAITIGLRNEPQRPVIDMLCDYLSKKKMLIILDNCEHLVDACAQMSNRILRAAPDVRILASSREVLGIAGEVTYRVPSLGLPDINHLPPVELLTQYEAVKLFIDRATAAVPSFKVTNENAPFLAQICHRLDGIPLAIELAAAKIRVLNLEQIAKRLDDRFRLLTGGSRTAMERHQTLRATVDWSYNLLSPNEQILFRRLSVFVGGWTIEAAESVCSEDSIKSDDVLDLLEHLVNKSIVIAEETKHETRYRMLETIRQYMREKLFDAEEVSSIYDRHLVYFAAFAEKANAGVIGSEPEIWAGRLLTEINNFRRAMDWAEESGQAQVGLYLGGSLHSYWIALGGNWREGSQRLERLLALPSAAGRTLSRVLALLEAGNLTCHLGDYEKGLAFLEEGKAIGLEIGEPAKLLVGWILLALAEHLAGRDRTASQHLNEEGIVLLREVGEPWQLWLGLGNRGWMAMRQGKHAQARIIFSEQLKFVKKIQSRFLVGISQGALGNLLYMQGDFRAALPLLEESVAILHPLGDLRHQPLGALGAISLLHGDYQQAVAYFEERLVNHRRQGSMVYLVRDLSNLGIVTAHLGDSAQAATFFHEALLLAQESKDLDLYDVAVCLLGIAGVQLSPYHSTQLLAAAQTEFERSGDFIEPLYRIERERTENKILEVLDSQDFIKFSAEGRALTLEQAIELALEKIDE